MEDVTHRFFQGGRRMGRTLTREQMRAAVETCDRELRHVDIAMEQFFDRIRKKDPRVIDIDFRVLPDVKGALTNGST